MGLLQIDCDAEGLHPTEMSDIVSVFPKFGNGYAFAKDMINELFNTIRGQSFTKNGAILAIKYCSLEDLKFQNIPVKEKIERKS